MNLKKSRVCKLMSMHACIIPYNSNNMIYIYIYHLYCGKKYWIFRDLQGLNSSFQRNSELVDHFVGGSTARARRWGAGGEKKT